MSPSHPRSETIETAGSRVVLRRVSGPQATELFVHAQPRGGAADAGGQVAETYGAILDALDAEGAGLDAIVSETLFFASLRRDLAAVRAARDRVRAERGSATQRSAVTEIEQPPLDERARVEVSLQAVVPVGAPPRVEPLEARSNCACADCARAYGVRVHVGDELRLHAGALCGRGEDAYAQALAVFEVADDLLQRAGMTFADVVRTWIHLRDIDRDYGDLNRARRSFFESRRIDPVPASTGIGGGPAPEAHDLCLGLVAVRSPVGGERSVMSSPTLNEAPEYGADFSRGMRVLESNKIALHVSGTASIDEAGRTAHPGRLGAQVDRMLVNVAALLEGQGAGFDDVVSAVTYLKHPADAAELRTRLASAGFGGFPHALVAAPICRPELLCETEVLAVRPRSGPEPGAAS